jgi:hypothetical protein
MGIYPSNKVYGIRIYNYINDDFNLIFEKKYDTEMTSEMIHEVKLFYDISIQYLEPIHYKIFTEYSCTHEKDKNNIILMDWFKISYDDFQLILQNKY